MTFDWHSLLAAEDGWGSIGQLVLIIVLLVLGGLGSLVAKIKEKRDAEQAERKVREQRESRADQKPATREAPPKRQPTPAEQAMIALRSAFGGFTGREEAPSPPPVPPKRPPEPKVPAVARRGDLGEGAREEVRRLEQHLSAEQTKRRRRLGKIERLRPGISDAPMPTEPAAAARRIRVDLGGRKAAMTAIIYSEILGPPKALRHDPEPWD